MANWLLAIDADEGRRKAYAAGVAAIVAPIAGLQVAQREGSGWSVVWAAAQNAPVSVDVGSAGGAVLWGDARDAAGALQTAADIRSAWRDGASAQWDGFYSALVVEDGARSVTVGTDLLGIFPVYYWTDGNGLVLIGTSAELFRSHPRFSGTLNVTGLVGILLTNGLVGGETLWRGVQRLGPGQRLRIDNGKVFEDEGYRIPVSLAAVDLPLEGHVQQLADAVAAAVKRHAPQGRSYGLLLSGGLDSRLFAGFLNRAQIKPHALTVGLPGDLDMRCAKAVAATYGLQHAMAEPNAEHYVDYAELQSRWEHLANGFNTVRDWWTQSRVGTLGERLVTGGLADAIIGGTSLSWAFTADPPSMSYDAFVKQMPRLGVPSPIIRQMLKSPQHDGVVDHVERALRTEFEAYSDRRSYCAWRYDLAHGQRYHVGGTVWRLSFGAWPVLPVLDRAVVQVAAGIPASSLTNRAAQLELVRTVLPELASVPMDRSDLMAEVPQYLTPRLRHQVQGYLLQRWHAARDFLRLGALSGESRYWYRVNNFDGDAWMRVRHGAGSAYAALGDDLDINVLKNILAPPGEPVVPGPWVGESGRKLLLGLSYWAKERA